jgi:hypothetical protein
MQCRTVQKKGMHEMRCDTYDEMRFLITQLLLGVLLTDDDHDLDHDHGAMSTIMISSLPTCQSPRNTHTDLYAINDTFHSTYSNFIYARDLMFPMHFHDNETSCPLPFFIYVGSPYHYFNHFHRFLHLEIPCHHVFELFNVFQTLCHMLFCFKLFFKPPSFMIKDSDLVGNQQLDRSMIQFNSFFLI